jgi:hypothetical protein
VKCDVTLPIGIQFLFIVMHAAQAECPPRRSDVRSAGHAPLFLRPPAARHRPAGHCSTPSARRDLPVTARTRWRTRRSPARRPCARHTRAPVARPRPRPPQSLHSCTPRARSSSTSSASRLQREGGIVTDHSAGSRAYGARHGPACGARHGPACGARHGPARPADRARSGPDEAVHSRDPAGQHRARAQRCAHPTCAAHIRPAPRAHNEQNP